MQMFRKAAVATLIMGAGLASTAGVAMAHENGGDSAAKGCSNAAAAKSSNGADRTLGDTTGGDQAFDLSNTCDILNGNKVLSDNNAATGASTITNGDTTTVDETSTSTSTITDVFTGLLPI